MHLVQLLLPLRDDAGRPFPRARYDRLAEELTSRFGGVTAYSRAPASGLWEEASGARQRDDIVVYEVMTEELDVEWWSSLRRRLEAEFVQQELVIRAHVIRRI